MADSAILHPPAWPELLKPAMAAAMIGVSESTWRQLWRVLAARHGLKVIGLAGPKFRRTNVLEVLDRLEARGLDITIDKAAGVVRIGTDTWPIGSGRTGKSGRGRPAKTINPTEEIQP